MEIKYTNFEVDPKLYGKDSLCAIKVEDGNFLYETIYDVKDMQYKDFLPVGAFLKLRLKKEQKSLVDEMIEALEINKELLKRPLKTLSRGELLKVLVIKASVSNAKAIILDHLDSVLNYKDTANILKSLKRNLGKFGKTILVVTNNFDNISMYVKRFIVIKENKVVYSGEDFNSDYIESEIKSFTKLANKKGAALNNYKDPSDLLKAIYRSVK